MIRSAAAAGGPDHNDFARLRRRLRIFALAGAARWHGFKTLPALGQIARRVKLLASLRLRRCPVVMEDEQS